MDNYLAKLQDVAYYRSSACFNGSVTSPIDNLSIFLTTPLAILACMATVAANVLLALVTAWAIAYAGVFVLGFGGARWTSDIALSYFRSVTGIGLKLMTMTLLVGIAVSIIDDYHADLAAKASMDELLVIFVVSLVLVILVNTIPNVMAGLIPGGGGAASAGSSFGAGAIIGAGMAAAGMATGGAALAGKAAMGAVAGAAGGASAIQAAFQKASASMGESGGDMLAGVMGGGDEGGSALASAMGGGDAGTEDTPFAQAGGFGGGESGGGSDSTGSSSSDSSSSGGNTAAGGESSSSMSEGSSGGESPSPSSGGVSRAAKLAVGTAGELAKGIGGQFSAGFQERISETTGGKLAASIRQSMEPKEAGQFEGNSLGGGMNEEIAAFVNRDNENKG